MFSLIVTVIAIALVAALAIATLYFGGSIWTSGKDSAKAATLINESSQIEGAIKIYQTEQGSLPATLADLKTTNYLSEIPSGNWEFQTDAIMASGIDQKTCEAANAKLGITGAIPSCTDPAIQGVTVCCSLS